MWEKNINVLESKAKELEANVASLNYQLKVVEERKLEFKSKEPTKTTQDMTTQTIEQVKIDPKSKEISIDVQTPQKCGQIKPNVLKEL